MPIYKIAFEYEGSKCGIVPTDGSWDSLNKACAIAEKLLLDQSGIVAAPWYKYPDGSLEFIIESDIDYDNIESILTNDQVKCVIAEELDPASLIGDENPIYAGGVENFDAYVKRKRLTNGTT